MIMSVFTDQLPSLLPLAAWIVLLLATTLVTWLFYRLTSRLGKNVAWLRGPVGTLSLRLGGPIVLFWLLIGLGKPFIPIAPYTVLSGKVTDSNGKPVANATVIATRDADQTQTGPDGAFSLRVPHASNRQYDFVVYKNGANFTLENPKLVEDPKKVVIDDYPSNETIAVAKGLKDQFNQPLDDVQIFFEAVAEPQGGAYSAKHGSLSVKVEPDQYRFIVKKAGKQIYADRFHIVPGQTVELPRILSIKGEHHD